MSFKTPTKTVTFNNYVACYYMPHDEEAIEYRRPTPRVQLLHKDFVALNTLRTRMSQHQFISEDADTPTVNTPISNDLPNLPHPFLERYSRFRLPSTSLVISHPIQVQERCIPVSAKGRRVVALKKSSSFSNCKLEDVVEDSIDWMSYADRFVM